MSAAKQGAALAAFIINPGDTSLRRLVEACAGADGLATRKLAQALGSCGEETMPREWAARLQEAFCFALPPLPFDTCRGTLEDLARECADEAPEAAAAAEALLASEVDHEPAVGSVAQVYFHGRLALKVLRPGVEEEVELLRALARFAAPPLSAVGRSDAAELVQQAARDLEAQTDLREELERLHEAEEFLRAAGCHCATAPRGVCATREVLVMTRVPSIHFHPDGSSTAIGGASEILPKAALEELRWRTDAAAGLFFIAAVLSDEVLHVELHPANYGCRIAECASTKTSVLVVYDLGACVSKRASSYSEFFIFFMEERWLEAMELCVTDPTGLRALLDAACQKVTDGKTFASALSRLARRQEFPKRMRPEALRVASGFGHVARLFSSCGRSALGLRRRDGAARASRARVGG